MISDDEVRQFYQKKLETPGAYGGAGSLQIYRGISPRLWKDAHPQGCLRHLAVFGKFGVIPRYCFDCYKVLIEPRNVVELFKLLMVFEKLTLPNDNTRKCMVEGREDCSGTYKGFIFCRSKEEGKEVRNNVRAQVSDAISREVPVTLKRGCSEYARAYPAYSPTKPGAVAMNYNNDWQAHEDYFDKNFVFVENTSEFSGAAQVTANADNNDTRYSPAEIFAMRYWLSYAATIGDTSYLKISGCRMPTIPQLKRQPFVTAIPHTRHK
ncbi:MAG: hypothetical protein AB1560_01350 [Pseudomonadota bacterium]